MRMTKDLSAVAARFVRFAMVGGAIASFMGACVVGVLV